MQQHQGGIREQVQWKRRCRAPHEDERQVHCFTFERCTCHFILTFFGSMKKMQKEMKDVELQLGIVANQV
jgi:hypothetical protein